MNHKEKLLEIYKKSFDVSDVDNISNPIMIFLENILHNIDRNKGVYTVLITLMVHKLIKPEQDIRYSDGWDNAKNNSCCPGDDWADGYNYAKRVILTKLRDRKE